MNIKLLPAWLAYETLAVTAAILTANQNPIGAIGNCCDSLTVGGKATLDGSLNVLFVNSLSPSAGDTYRILTATAGLSGTFANENLPTLVGDLEWFV
ncbi:MAG: hypothetical protein GY924_03170, partial [Planctomycetaceae bacterium]|nr:hypothetical protein [Planctomycetaceae bacterium]